MSESSIQKFEGNIQTQLHITRTGEQVVKFQTDLLQPSWSPVSDFLPCKTHPIYNQPANWAEVCAKLFFHRAHLLACLCVGESISKHDPHTRARSCKPGQNPTTSLCITCQLGFGRLRQRWPKLSGGDTRGTAAASPSVPAPLGILG